MADNRKVSYRNIVQSTIVFGGTQVAVTLLNLIRGKFIAMFLGAAGMGLSSLLINASTCIQQIAILGVNQAGVRDVSLADSTKDKALLFRISRILRNMVLLSAIFGLLATMAFSPLITHLSVGNSEYLTQFILLGAVVFFNILGLGEYTILQGTRQYKSIAYSTVVMPICGLLLGIPIYYMWGLDGIVPAMILQSLIYYVTVRHYVNKKGLDGQPLPHVSLRYTWQRGRNMIVLGLVMMTATLLGNLTTYAISAFISTTGAMADLGFYHAANMITMQCSGMVFSAMATDYYPKLAGIIDKDIKAARQLVNQQTEIVLLVIVPISMVIISVVPLIIAMLLTQEFQVMQRMMRFMGYSVIFKAICFPVDYMSYSKGDKKYFFWIEGVFLNIKTLLVFIGFYYYFGLEGLGYAALSSSVIDVVCSLSLNYWRYGFRLSVDTLFLFARLTLVATACFAFSFVSDTLVSYLLMGTTTLLCCLYSYRQLDKRIDVKSLIRRRRN